MFGLGTPSDGLSAVDTSITIKKEPDEDVNYNFTALTGFQACINDNRCKLSPETYATNISIKLEPDTDDQSYAHTTAIGVEDCPTENYSAMSPAASEPEPPPTRQTHEDFLEAAEEGNDDDDDDDTCHPNAKVCVFCSNTYSDVNALNLHIHVTHLTEGQQRVGESKSKPGPSDENSRTSGLPFDHCFTCSIDFSSALLLRVHVAEMHENCATGPCPFCGQVFKKSKLRAHHIHSTHPLSEADISDLTCPICRQQSTSASQLIKHVGTAHRVARTAFCPICAKGYSSPAVLRNHVSNVHGRYRATPCNTCGKVLANESSLGHHMRFAHQNRQLAFCELCNKQYTTRQVLLQHIATVHHGVKCGPCKYCGQYFRHRKSLRLHVGALHENSKTDPCEVCGRIFVMSFQLKAHMRKFHPELVYGSNRPPAKPSVRRK